MAKALTVEDSSAKAPDTPRIGALGGAGIALVVEHDPRAAELIQAQLEAEGFRVMHAASGAAALALAALQPLSLIALDIMLPNMDGWAFLSGLKGMPDLRRVPVVIISNQTGPNMRFSLGAAAVLEKPISRRELYESLGDLRLVPLPDGRKLRILVVDDDPRAVELIAVYTQAVATTVLRASGGREAIDVAIRELPDVIVLDLLMPEVNGFDVVAALNQHADTARIPILVVTAKQTTAEDRATLSRSVTTIMGHAGPDPGRFTAEVRRAISGRQVGG